MSRARDVEAYKKFLEVVQKLDCCEAGGSCFQKLLTTHANVEANIKNDSPWWTGVMVPQTLYDTHIQTLDKIIQAKVEEICTLEVELRNAKKHDVRELQRRAIDCRMCGHTFRPEYHTNQNDETLHAHCPREDCHARYNI